MYELNNDMEDMFRRAAESYPVKPASNWAAINSRLETVSPQVNKRGANKGKSFLLLLLFLFLGGGSFILVALLSTGPVDSSRESVDPGRQRSFTNQHVILPGNISVDQPGRGEADPASADLSRENGSMNNFQPVQHGAVHSLPDPVIEKYESQQFSGEHGGLREKSRLEPLLFGESPVFRQYPALANNDLPILATMANPSPAIRKPGTSILPPGETKGRKQPAFYFGITAGPGVNSVESFGHRWAFRGGLIAGLSFNERLSAETGLTFTKNFYEAKADHFAKDGIAGMLTGGRRLDEVHGSNQVLEIPVSIRYKISSRPKSFYGGAGLTSHLITRESNWYLTTINGSSEMLYGNYNNKKLYIASAVTISAGYQAPIGKKTLIRVEPYTQFPVRGIGVGKIRLRSTGLNISLTRTNQ